MEKARKQGITLSYDQGYEEMVADSMETILTDGNAVQMMAQLKQEDRTLLEKIRDWFKNLAAELKAVVEAYREHRPDSAEGRMVADMQDMIGVLESLYTEALVEASDNYQAIGAEKNTTREDGVKYQARENTELPYLLHQKLLNKKAINTTQKDYAKVSDARVESYRGMSSDDLPDIDFFDIAEYKKVDTGYIYTFAITIKILL